MLYETSEMASLAKIGATSSSRTDCSYLEKNVIILVFLMFQQPHFCGVNIKQMIMPTITRNV